MVSECILVVNKNFCAEPCTPDYAFLSSPGFARLWCRLETYHPTSCGPFPFFMRKGHAGPGSSS